MKITAENADADCRLGEPAPRGADTVWHHDLEKIPGGERCLECGAVWRNGAPRRKNQAPSPQPNVTLDVDALAASIVTAACELDGPADPAGDDTISITLKDLEAVVQRHVTAALERQP